MMYRTVTEAVQWAREISQFLYDDGAPAWMTRLHLKVVNEQWIVQDISGNWLATWSPANYPVEFGYPVKP